MDKTCWLRKRGVKEQGKPLRVSVGLAGLAGSGLVSGDSVCYGEIGKGIFAVVLSDGMGSGRRAKRESELIVQTVEHLLRAGYSPPLALQITNAVMVYRAGRGEECYSSLDLALIDLQTGNLQLYKTGASLTLIRRGNQLDVVMLPSLPMGVVGDLPVPSWNHRLRTGDQLILLSDGIAEAGRRQGIRWLKDEIFDQTSSDPCAAAEHLLHRARAVMGGKEKDDMTAVVLVVQ